jgi:mono/diheme cytochrome c family protein
MKFKHVFYVLAVLLFTASCEYKMIEQEDVVIPEEGLSYAENVEPIILDNCTSCHGNSGGLSLEGNSYETLINGSNGDGVPYIDTETADDSYLLIKLNEGSHSSFVTSQELGIIKAWIQDGANE